MVLAYAVAHRRHQLILQGLQGAEAGVAHALGVAVAELLGQQRLVLAAALAEDAPAGAAVVLAHRPVEHHLALGAVRDLLVRHPPGQRAHARGVPAERLVARGGSQPRGGGAQAPPPPGEPAARAGIGVGCSTSFARPHPGLVLQRAGCTSPFSAVGLWRHVGWARPRVTRGWRCWWSLIRWNLPIVSIGQRPRCPKVFREKIFVLLEVHSSFACW
mmetsp:Transcript_14276/g.19686  ORF Transcript_14276/g.19686 Transcript_14276/m.19686 type:complete len:216 (+) Transcript_14276:853-1500(+)